MSEAALAKIQKDVSTNVLKRLDLIVICFLFFLKCAKLESELAVYKNSQPISTSCEA
jgi:hypothetical protein